MLKVVMLGFVACTLTSCMWMASTPSGVREFYRGQTGLVVTGKSKPNVVDDYNKTERFTEEQKTFRLQLKGGSSE